MTIDVGSMEFKLMASMVQLQKDMDQAKSLVGNAVTSINSSIGLATKALAALGMAATVDHFSGLVKSAISAQAELAKLSERTGTTVETLSGLKSVAKLSGTDMETVSSSIQKLSKSMVSVGDGAGKSASAFSALGISSKEVAANLNNPGQMMLVIAKRLEEFGNGAGKTAAMIEIFGKSGANLLPMMKDLAEKGELVATVTDAQARAAEVLDRQFLAWDNRMKGLYSTIALAVTPALSDFMDALIKAQKEADGMTQTAKRLSDEGTLTEWARSATTAIALVIDVANGVVVVFKSVGMVIGATAAEFVTFGESMAGFFKITGGNVKEGISDMQSASNRMRAIGEQLADDLDALWMKQSFSDKLDSVNEDRIKKQQDFAARSIEVLRLYAGQSVEIQQAAMRELAKNSGLTYSGQNAGKPQVNFVPGTGDKALEAYRARIAALDGLYKQEQNGLAANLHTLESMHKTALLGDVQYENQRYDATQESYEKLIDLTNKKMQEAQGAGQVKDAAKYMAELGELYNKELLEWQKHGDELLKVEHKTQQELEKIDIDAMKARGDLVGVFTVEFSNKYADMMTKAVLDGNVKLQKAIESAWQAGMVKAKFDQMKASLDTVFVKFDNDMRDVFTYAESSGGLGAAIGAQELTDQLIQGSIPAAKALIDQMMALAAINPGDQAIAKGLEDAKAKLKEYENASIKAANTVSNAWKKMGDDMNTSLSRAFGSIGSSLGNVLKAYTTFNADRLRKDQAYEAERGRIAEAGLNGDEGAWQRLSKATSDYHKQSIQDSLTMYGDMAGAAKNMFDEQSEGYRILSGIEKAMYAIKFALQAQELAMALTNSETRIGAIMAEFMASGSLALSESLTIPPPMSFVAFAATAALLASIGWGGSASGAAPNLSAERQAKQGTGTVFGDSSAKSDSINKSIERLAGNSDITLVFTNQMLAALNTIRDNIGGLVNIIVRSTGLLGGAGDTAGLGLGTSGDIIFGKSSTTLTDQGLQIGVSGTKQVAQEGYQWGPEGERIPYTYYVDQPSLSPQTIGQVRASGMVDAVKYSSTHTEDSNGLIDPLGIFGGGGSSDSTTYKVLEKDAKHQIALTVLSIADGVQAAAMALGMGGDEVIAKIDAFAVNLGEEGLISLKGLSGQALQDALNGVFSKFGDQLAEAVMPGLDAFVKVGEGYMETLIRVASGVEKAKVSMEMLGLTAISYTDIIRKQGDTYTEIARQTIVGAEGGVYDKNGKMSGSTGIGSIIQTSGAEGDDLVALYKTLKDIQHQMTAVGLAGADVTVTMVKAAGGLDALKSGVQSYYDNFFSDSERFVMMGNDQVEVFAKMGVTMPKSNAEFRALVNSIDRTTEAGQKLYGKLMGDAEAFASYTAAEAEAKSKTLGLRLTEAQLMGDTAAATAIVNEQRAAELAGMSASDAAIQQHIYQLQDQADADQAAADAAQKAAQKAADAIKQLSSDMGSWAGAIDKLTGNNAMSTYIHQLTANSTMADVTKVLPQYTSVNQLLSMTADEFSNLSEADRQLVIDALNAAGVVRDDFNSAINATAAAAEEAARKVKSLNDFIEANFFTPSEQAAHKVARANEYLLSVLGPTVDFTHMTYEEFLNLLDTLGLTPDVALQVAQAFIDIHGPAKDATEAINGAAAAFAGIAAGWVYSGDVISQATANFQSHMDEIKSKSATLAAGDTGLEFSGSIARLQEYMKEIQKNIDWRTPYGEQDAELFYSRNQMELAQKALANLTTDYARYTILEAQYKGHGKELLDLEKWYKDQQAIFGGNQEDLTALSVLYEKKRLDIINGTLSTGLGQTAEEMKKWAQGLRGWLQGLNQNSSLSPLTAQQKKDAAYAVYMSDLAKAQAGDQAAREAITKDAEAYLEAAKAVSGFGGDYSAIFAMIKEQIADLADAADPSGAAPTVIDPVSFSQTNGFIAEGTNATREQTAEVIKLRTEVARLLEQNNELMRRQTQQLSNETAAAGGKTASAITKAAELTAKA